MKIQVKVTLGSGIQMVKNEPLEKTPKINKNISGFYTVKLKSSPENNKANIELIKLLKKYFKAKEVKIKSGFT